MILEENYRKVAEYTQKAFKLYSRRYFANLMLQILQKKQKIKQFQKTSFDFNRNTNFSQKQDVIELQNVENEKQFDRQNPFNRTIKNIDVFDALDKENIYTDISYLKYGDIVFLQIYNAGMNLSDKSQRLRVYTELQSLKYRRLIHLNSQSLTQKKCAFQIVNPYDCKNTTTLNGNSLFCLKSIFCDKYLCAKGTMKVSQFFGYEVSLSTQITPQCFISFKGVESKQKKIVSYEPIGLKISSYLLRAEGLEICCNVEGSVFYFNKVSTNVKNFEPHFVKFKSVSLQKFLGSNEIEMNKLMSKKTYSNVTIEDENGIPIKQNTLGFNKLDFDKIGESEVLFENYEDEDSLRHIWLLNPVQKNGTLSRQQVKITHVCSGRNLVVKTDKSIKLSINPIQVSYFGIKKYTENSKAQTNNLGVQNMDEQPKGNNKVKNGLQTNNLGNEIEGNNRVYELVYQQSNVMVMKSRDELDHYYLGVNEIHSLGHYKIEENKRILFEVINISPHQSQLFLELMEIQSILRESYEFIEKVGFILDETRQSLRFCVEQIKKQNHLILYHIKVIKVILHKIDILVQGRTQSEISPAKIQTLIKQIKIFQTLICISKILNLKIAKKKSLADPQANNDPRKIPLLTNDSKQKYSQTPFDLCTIYFQQLQGSIFQTIYKLTVGNQKCSNTIVREANFFNKLLVFHPQEIGRILQQAIKNLSLFTSKASNNQCSELFQWVKLIETLKEENIMVQKTYIDIIAQVVVDPQDRGIITYQNKCRQLLFNQRNKKKIMPRFGYDDGKPTIAFETSSITEFFNLNSNLLQIEHYSNTEPCFSIEDFFTLTFDEDERNKKTEEYIQYIVSLVRLMRNLCKDRNKKLLKVAQDYGLGQDHITNSLNSTKIQWRLKIQYLLLYSVVFVDQDPFLSFERRQTQCHVWSKIDQYNLDNRTSLIFKQYTDLGLAVQRLRQFDINIIPFLENYTTYCKKLNSTFLTEIKNNHFDKFLNKISEQLKIFQAMIKFIYEVINFGYFTIYFIKKFITFVLNHYQSICSLFEFVTISFTLKENEDKFSQIKSTFMKKQDEILHEILKILELNENIWIDINAINMLKSFQKKYRQKTRPMTAFELKQNCWRLLNNQIPFLAAQDSNSNKPKHSLKKKTTTKNVFTEDFLGLSSQDVSNAQFDVNIGKFLIRIVVSHNELAQTNSYNKVVELISKRQRRNIELYEKLSSFLIINGKKQQNIYRDYSGRVTGKILNVIKIYELINRIKSSEHDDPSIDQEDEKRKKQKIIQLNNLISKIKREISQVKDQDMGLFKKFQLILEKLNIDMILMELLTFAHKPLYLECISNLYKFYLEFIWENQQNRQKLSRHFQLFITNFKVQKCSVLISELFASLKEDDKRKYLQKLFEKLHLSSGSEESSIKQSVLETLYRIIKKTKEKELLVQIKSQLSFQIFKENDYTSLLSLNTNLSAQYINVLCQLASNGSFMYEKIRKIYPKTILRKIIYQQHNYSQRSILLKLFYYFYIKNNNSLETHQIEDLISNLVLPQIKHLPSVCQFLVLQNLQIKQSTNQKPQKQQKKNTTADQEQSIDLLKRKFEDLILYEHTVIEPSEQQKYWNFIYNSEDQTQMSLINFIISLLKMQSFQNPEKCIISKKLAKSTKYLEFIKYLTDLCQFMKDAFKKNKDKYQRRIINKLQEILIINEERSDNRLKTMYSNISQEDKDFLKTFFDQISNMIINENISYSRIIECAGVSNEQLNKRRMGQNIELMILEQKFIKFIQNLMKYITNVKQFNRVITEKKISYFFSVYKCAKVRKINIYKFLQKLFEYLESLKNKSIHRLHTASDNDESNNKTMDLKVRNELYSFIDKANENIIIDAHFRNYVVSYNFIIKLTLLRKWIDQNERYVDLVFEDLEKESQVYPLKKEKIQEIMQSIPHENFNENNSLSGRQSDRNSQSIILVHLSLYRLCYGGSFFDRQRKNYLVQEYQKCFKDNLIEIDSRYYKTSASFSRIVLFLIRKINSYGSISIQTDPVILRKYIMQKLVFYAYKSSRTLNEILFELIINLNKSQTAKKQHTILGKSKLFLSRNTLKSKVLTTQNLQDDNSPQQNKLLGSIICEQIFKRLDYQINQILAFDFRYSISSCLQQSNFLEHLTPSNFSFKVEILSYGIVNNLIPQKHLEVIQDCFVKIINIWANNSYDFDDQNWLIILKSIIQFLDKFLNNVKQVADALVENQQYARRFTELLQCCCLQSLKSTTIKNMTQLSLLHLLNSFHMKFYLENQQIAVALILNGVDFELLASSAQKTYNYSIEPKLNQFENQNQCGQNTINNTKICSLQVCNDNKITENDHTIMEMFVSFLIIIQLSISLNKKHYFANPLKNKNLQVLNHFEQQIREHDIQNTSLKQISYISFYKRFIGMVYLSSDEGSLVSLHFMIPYLEKYCNSNLRSQILYYFKKMKKLNIEHHLNLFSKYFEAQLEEKKYYSKIPLLPFVLLNKSKLQKIIICIVIAHLFTAVFPGVSVNEIYFYPFTAVFIVLKIIFLVAQYRKTQNVIRYIYQDKEVSWRQKLEIYSSQKVLISLTLIILYITSLKIPPILGLVTVFETLNIRYVNKLANIQNKALMKTAVDIVIFLGLIAVYFGIMEWESQKNQQFIKEILSSFKEFYTFVASNFKITLQNDYTISKKFPYSFFVYISIIAFFIYKYLKFFITELKRDSDQSNAMEKRCLICDKRSNQFENDGVTYQDHIKFQHNLWHYLYFFIYLRRKSQKDIKNLKNIEISIKESLDKKKYGFLKMSQFQQS